MDVTGKIVSVYFLTAYSGTEVQLHFF